MSQNVYDTIVSEPPRPKCAACNDTRLYDPNDKDSQACPFCEVKLDMLAALRLAMERPGARVRPKCWGKTEINLEFWFDDELHVFRSKIRSGFNPIDNPDEIFGPWEQCE